MSDVSVSTHSQAHAQPHAHASACGPVTEELSGLDENPTSMNKDTIDTQDTENTKRRRRRGKKNKSDALPSVVPVPVTLLEAQVPHVRRLLAIFEQHPYAIDLSMLGSGKTYTACAVAERMGARNVIVVCPVSVKSKWEHMQRAHGLPVSRILSFCELRSVTGKQPHHGLLTRRDYTMSLPVGNGDVVQFKRVEFEASRQWNETIRNEKTLLVIDEMQNVKNMSSQFFSTQAIIQTIFRHSKPSGSDSRVLLLSGSPVDKQEQVVNLFRLLGVVKSEELGKYCLVSRSMVYTGMEDIVRYCSSVDPVATSNTSWRKDMREFAFHLFKDAVKPHVATGMPAPECKYTIKKLNACYRIESKRDQVELKRGICDLSDACKYDPESGTVNFSDVNFVGANNDSLNSIRMVTLAMMKIESAKVETFVRIAKKRLVSSSREKVIIGVNYNDSIRCITTALSDHDPLVLNGALSSAQRARVLRQFQSPDTRYRLLVANVCVCSTGIDLDDKDGRFPRLALVSPNYSTIALYQMGQRLLRADTRSNSELHYVFGIDLCEFMILRALARKSEVMRQFGCEKTGTLYPGDYPFWDENEDDMKQNAAAITIQRHWRESITNPLYQMCRDRLTREFEEMSHL